MWHDKPGDDKVKEAHRVSRQGLPVGRLAVTQKLKCSVNSPHEARQCDHTPDNEEGHAGGTSSHQDDPADGQGEAEGEKAVPQDTDTLEQIQSWLFLLACNM